MSGAQGATHRTSRAFARFSAGFALFHLTVEMLYHVRYGQPFTSLLVDFIAIGLLALGAWLHLRRGWGPGVLCGAWGFELCLTYRSFFWRVEEIRAGTASEVTRNTAIGLGALLVVVAVSFIVSIRLCAPSRGER
jgi:hypothetical protein